MKAIWAAALLLAAAAMAGIGSIPLEPASLGGAKIVFVGSSLTAGVIPLLPVPGGILGDARPHTRLTRAGPTEAEANELLRVALRHPVEEVFVEIAAYVRTFPNWPEPVTPPWAAGVGGGLKAAWAEFGERLRDKAGLLFGRKQTGLWGNLMEWSVAPDFVYDGGHQQFSLTYPLSIHPARRPAELGALLGEARRKGVQIVFFMVPRSSEASDFIGAEARDRLQEAYAEFSRRFAVEFWEPAESWPNEFFQDQAHANRRGRDRFVEALRARFGAP